MIELRVLGPTSLKRSDGSNVASLLAQPKRLALAVYLAAPPPHGGRCFHRKDTLVAMFWPELDQQHARAALRNSLYFLRNNLGPNVVRTGENDSVGLDPNELWCDLDAFDVAVRMRDHATAFQLYRGQLLEGVFVQDAQPFEEWLDAQRDRRGVEARSAASQAARRQAAAGRYEEALIWATRARAMAPSNEDAARLLIALRHLTGDRTGALEEYHRLEQFLDAEHGVEPSADTLRLVQAVRHADADSASIASAIAQVPVPPPTASPLRASTGKRAVMHDRAVLDAIIQSRVGAARRRGDKVGVILVRVDESRDRSSFGNGTGDGATSLLDATGTAILGGIRDADVIGRVDACTLALLPADDGGRDVNAFVGRLLRHLQRSQAQLPELAGTNLPQIDTVWLDPSNGRSGRELLDEALQPA
jgi:DNA-binding SARP family transcriptional activator